MTNEIELRIHEESDLFSPLDPRQMQLSEDVISYLTRNTEIIYRKCKGKFAIHIFSDTPVNEDKVKKAFREQILLDLESNRFWAKLETIKEAVLVLFGLSILSLWYVMTESGEGLYLEIMEIVGWVAIWEASTSALLRRPELYHKKREYEFALKADIIVDVSPRDLLQ